MIVNVRLDVTEEQRSALSLRLFPKSLKRLATRQEVNEYMTDHLERVNQPDTQSRFEEPVNVKPSRAHAHAHVDSEPEPPYQPSIDKVCAEYKKITGIRRLVESVTNAMFALVNAERVSKEHHPESTERLMSLRGLVQDYRYELADLHDSECYEELDAHDKEYGE